MALRAWILQKIRAGDKEFVITTETREDVLEYVEGVQRECREPSVLHNFRNLEEESRAGEEASGSLRETGGREEKAGSKKSRDSSREIKEITNYR